MKLQQEKHELELEVQDAQWRVDQGQPPNVRMPRRVLLLHIWKRTSPRPRAAGGGGARVGAPCSRSNVQAKRGRAAGPATGRSHRCFRPSANHAHNGGATAKCVHSRRHWDTEALRYVLSCASLALFRKPSFPDCLCSHRRARSVQAIRVGAWAVAHARAKAAASGNLMHAGRRLASPPRVPPRASTRSDFVDFVTVSTNLHYQTPR